MTAEDQARYKGFYGADYRAMIERVAANADSPQLTTNAIVEAITCASPATRYLLGQVVLAQW